MDPPCPTRTPWRRLRSLKAGPQLPPGTAFTPGGPVLLAPCPARPAPSGHACVRSTGGPDSWATATPPLGPTGRPSDVLFECAPLPWWDCFGNHHRTNMCLQNDVQTYSTPVPQKVFYPPVSPVTPQLLSPPSRAQTRPWE